MERKIQIDKQFYIKSASVGYSLNFEMQLDTINEKTGKPKISKEQWFYPSVKMCLKQYLEESMRPSQSVKDLIDRIEEAEKKIESFCKKYLVK